MTLERWQFEEIPLDNPLHYKQCYQCKERISFRDVRSVMPCCAHFYHSECLLPLLQRNAKCPFCDCNIHISETLDGRCLDLHLVVHDSREERGISEEEWSFIPSFHPQKHCSSCRKIFSPDIKRRRMPCCNRHYHEGCLYRKLRRRSVCPSCERQIRVEETEDDDVYLICTHPAKNSIVHLVPSGVPRDRDLEQPVEGRNQQLIMDTIEISISLEQIEDSMDSTERYLDIMNYLRNINMMSPLTEIRLHLFIIKRRENEIKLCQRLIRYNQQQIRNAHREIRRFEREPGSIEHIRNSSTRFILEETIRNSSEYITRLNSLKNVLQSKIHTMQIDIRSLRNTRNYLSSTYSNEELYWNIIRGMIEDGIEENALFQNTGDKVQFFRDQVKSLPPVRMTKDLVVNGLQCSICLEYLPQRNSKQLPCLHFYHEFCLTLWFKEHSTCPNCRHVVELKRITRTISCPSLFYQCTTA